MYLNIQIYSSHSDLNACQDGLGHPYIVVKTREKVPLSAHLSEGGGRSLFVQCPNGGCNFLSGASLTGSQ